MLVTIFSLLFLFIGIVPFLNKEKKEMKVIVLTFVSFFTFFNILKVFNNHHIYLLSIFFAFIVGFVLFVILFNLNKHSKMLFISKKRLIASISMLVGVGLFILFRIGYHHQSSDVLFYINFSNEISMTDIPGEIGKIGLNKISSPEVYWSQINIWVASFVEDKGLYYSLISEVISGLFIVVVVRKFINDNFKKTYIKVMIFLLMIVVSSLFIHNISSSLNWNIAAITFITILVYRKENVVLLLVPIAASAFSMSAILLLPISLVVVLLNKKISLFVMALWVFAALTFVILFLVQNFKMTDKLLILMIFLPFVYSIGWTINKKSLNNPLYLFYKKINSKIDFNPSSYIKKIILIALYLIISIPILVIYIINKRVYDYTVVVQGGNFKLYFILFLIMSLAYFIMIFHDVILSGGKFNKELFLFLTITVTYLVALYVINDVLHSKMVLNYLFVRTHSSILITGPIWLVMILLLCLSKINFNKKGFINISMGAMAISTPIASISLALVFDYQKQLAFIGKPSENYSFLNEKEKEFIRKNANGEVVYSDMPVFLVDGVKSFVDISIMKSPYQKGEYYGRWLYFFRDMETTSRWALETDYYRKNHFFIWSFTGAKRDSRVTEQILKRDKKEPVIMMIKSKVYNEKIKRDPYLKSHFKMIKTEHGIALYDVI